MRYEYDDGFRFEADTPEEICAAIHNSMKFRWTDSLEEWMRDHAERCSRWDGKIYSAENFEEHVIDLLRHGVIRRIGD
jgi:hypothetical protein